MISFGLKSIIKKARNSGEHLDLQIEGVKKQDWVRLDRRGNWLIYRELGDGVERDERRRRSGVNAYTQIDPDGPALTSPITGNCLSKCVAPVTPTYDLAGNLVFNPLAKVAGQSAGECGTAIPGCGPGQEYVYDVANRVVAIHRDTNDAAGPLTGSNPEPKLMEFIYDALGRRVETIEYVNPATGELWDGQGSNPPPRRTRHVYFGLEVIQEYACDG